MPTEITNIYLFWSDAANQWIAYTAKPDKQFHGTGISMDLAIENLRKKATEQRIKVLPQPILHDAPEEQAAELEKYFKIKMATMRI